jgi:hypothetical protein
MYENIEYLDTLAAAYASAGKFDEAVSTARKAVELVEATDNENLAQVIRDHLELFKEGRSYIEKPLIKDKTPEK